MNLNQYSTDNIYNYLNSVASGQEEAKKALAYVGFMYNARRQVKQIVNEKFDVKRSNLLLMGPTGCGKTHLAKALGTYLKLPFIEIDAPTISPTGYSGKSMAELISESLSEYKRSHGLKGKISSAIIFIDEIDKLCLNAPTTRSQDFNAEKQNDILKLVEGKDMAGDSATHTSNYLFICAGSFMHMERNQTRKSIGFTNKLEVPNEEKQETLHRDVVKAGLKPELAGRLSLIVELKELSKDDLIAAFMSVKDNIYQQYKNLFKYTNKKELILSESEIDQIIETCIKNGTGARGLQTQLDNLLFMREQGLKVSIEAEEILEYPRDAMKILALKMMKSSDTNTPLFT